MKLPIPPGALEAYRRHAKASDEARFAVLSCLSDESLDLPSKRQAYQRLVEQMNAICVAAKAELPWLEKDALHTWNGTGMRQTFFAHTGFRWIFMGEYVCFR